jgi:hypothetical protein
MDAGAVALLIPVAAIVMGGLVRIARDFARGHRNPDMSAWDARMEALEHDLASVRSDLNETQEQAPGGPRVRTRGSGALRGAADPRRRQHDRPRLMRKSSGGKTAISQSWRSSA